MKADTAFKTITEVSEELKLPAHVLRFWETKFTQIQPLKRGGGRRYYRPEDIRIVRRIRDLLHFQGYTIRGVQQLLEQEESAKGRAVFGVSVTVDKVPVAGAPANVNAAAAPVIKNNLDLLQSIRLELSDALNQLNTAAKKSA